MSAELIEQANKILTSHGTAEAIHGSATVTTEIIETRDVIMVRLKDFGDCTGWITVTDEVIPITTAQKVDEKLLKGRNQLSAELVNDKKSLHLRQAPEGWLLTTITAKDEAGDMIMFKESFESKLKKGQKLQYETYWRLQTDASSINSYRPYVSRFVGFEKKEGENE